jgi:Zn-dependent membrane protease YugP
MYFYYGDPVSMILMLVAIAITIGAQRFVKSNYNKYKEMNLDKKISGFEIARMILDKNNLDNIHIVEVKGDLSDHYDPKNKAVRLSKDIFDGETVAAASVAAHEVGHALQDKDGYVYMRVRHALVPIVNLTSKIGYIVIVIGFVFSFLDLVWIGIFLLASALVFQLVTLPVEINASKRALVELTKIGVMSERELDGGKTMLRAAAMTYVASVAATILQLLRLVLAANRRR